MGFLRGNTTSIGRYNDEEIPCIEGYSGEGAYLTIIAESVQNESVMFDESMEIEMNEVACEIQKEELESKGLMTEAAAIQIVTEGFADIKNKLKNMVIKAWQKIKSLYEAVKVRVSAFLTRDYNKFYKKHENTFNNYAKNTKGKYNFKMPKGKLDFSTLKYDSFSNVCHTYLKECEDKKEEEIKSDKEKIQDGSYLSVILGKSIKGSPVTKGEYKKELYDLLFSDKDTYEELNADIIKEVNDVLGTKDIIKNLNDAQKKNNDYFKKLLSEIDKVKGELNSSSNKDKTVRHTWDNSMKPDGEDPHSFTPFLGDEHAIDMKRMNLFSSVVTVNQTANNIINGEFISLIKMHIAQCKAVFTKVVSRSKFTEQILLDSIEDNVLNESLEFLNV